MLFDGVVTLILGFMIWNRWPIGSLWVIGTLVGVSMIMTGMTRLMMTLAGSQGGRKSWARVHYARGPLKARRVISTPTPIRTEYLRR